MKVQNIVLTTVTATFLVFSAGSLHAGEMGEQGASSAAADSDVSWKLIQGAEAPDDAGRGDWFKKKKILQQARTLYQDIQALVGKIVEGAKANATYVPSIDELGNKVRAIGVQPADVETLLKELETSIEATAAQEKLTEAERRTLIEQQDTKALLQQFLLDLKFAHELNEGLHEGITIATSQIEQCKAYEQRAWNLYEAIDAALNDTIAEQLFEEMQTIFENIGIIGNYLGVDLKGYFDKSIPLLQEQQKKLEEEYARLQDHGIFKKAAEPQPEPVKPPVKPVSRSWWQVILSPFIAFWNWVTSFFKK